MDATLERTAMTPSEQQRRLCRLRASYPFVYCRTLTATAGGRPCPPDFTAEYFDYHAGLTNLYL